MKRRTPASYVVVATTIVVAFILTLCLLSVDGLNQRENSSGKPTGEWSFQWLQLSDVSFRTFSGEDGETFRYANVAGQVFFVVQLNGRSVDYPFLGANAKTFEVATYLNAGGITESTKYMKDNQNVYFVYYQPSGDKPIRRLPNADPATFKLLSATLGLEVDGDDYAEDKSYVFHNGTTIPVDRDSYRLLPFNFSSDKNSVYYVDSGQDVPTLIPGADPTTFEVLNWVYAKDKNTVYYVSVHTGLNGIQKEFPSPILNSDPSTFKVDPANAYNGTDQKHFYRDGMIN